MHTKTIAHAIVAALCLGYGVSAHADVKYTITDLSTLGTGAGTEWTSINNAGDLGGTVDYHAATYIGGKLTSYAQFGVTSTALNNSGTFVFTTSRYDSYDESHGYVVKGGTVTPLQSLVAFPGNTSAAAINDHGVVVGSATNGGWQCTPDGYCSGTNRAVIYQSANAAPAELDHAGFTYGGAAAINNQGAVAGWIGNGSTNGRAFVYANDAMRYLDVPGVDTRPVGINDAGQVAGTAWNNAANVGWLYRQGQVEQFAVEGMESVVDLNNAGQIIGNARTDAYHAWIRTDEEVTLLDDLLHEDGWAIRRVYDMNDKGQIVGLAERADGALVSVILTPDEAPVLLPVPEPASYAMLPAGLLLLAAWRCKGRR